MLKLEKIYKQFGTKVIFQDTSFSVDKGSIVVLRGQSGIGKTTFLNLLAGLSPLDKGDYWFDGQLLNTADDEVMSDFRNAQIGYVVQEFALIEDYTVLENLIVPSLYSKSISKEEITLRAKRMLERFQMMELLDAQVKRLSGGQKQRVAIIRSLMLEPAMILADEPTSHLDKETAQFVLNLFKEQRAKGGIVIIATHDDEVARLADCSYVVDGNQLVKQTTTDRCSPSSDEN